MTNYNTQLYFTKPFSTYTKHNCVKYLLVPCARADRATMMARASGEEDKIEIVPHDQLRR